MPKRIKIVLTTYIIILGIIIITFENKIGDNSLNYLVYLLGIFMIVGIWIFPEVVTKSRRDK